MHEHDSVDAAVRERMQHDWNQRAREDAHFYVAFGRRDQDPEEFFATAEETVKGLEWELKRLGKPANPRARRALEIGCGPGRLMRPMSRHFGEIHGVDVSDEMIARARANLAGIPHAHPHHTSGADLAPFADESFDFVYSYAVFQHIPSREVVMQYLREAHRVLRPGGLLRVQLNGLDPIGTYDTWSGVRISAAQLKNYAREFHMQLLALEGVRTQYMWTSMIRRDPAEQPRKPAGATRIRRLTNAGNSEPVAPRFGRFASVSLWVESLPPAADLSDLAVHVDGIAAFPCYIGPAESDGIQQVNVILPKLPRTGLLPLELSFEGNRLADPVMLRVISPGPRVPVLLSVSDGVNLMSGTNIVTRSVKVTLEDVDTPDSFRAEISGEPLTGYDLFCADPSPPRWEINFRLPDSLPAGAHRLELFVGRRHIGPVEITVAPA